MTTKAKLRSRPAPRILAGAALTGTGLTPPWTTQERLQRIEAMGQRIDSYIKFMCQIDSLTGTSAEAKERAVIAFYEQMVAVESQLRSIQEDFRLE